MIYQIPPRCIVNTEKMSETRIYEVAGMSCDHCRNSVIEEIGELAGVTSVEVDLGRGAVEVAGAPSSDAQIEAAVAEAGYTVVGRGR